MGLMYRSSLKVGDGGVDMVVIRGARIVQGDGSNEEPGFCTNMYIA